MKIYLNILVFLFLVVVAVSAKTTQEVDSTVVKSGSAVQQMDSSRVNSGASIMLADSSLLETKDFKYVRNNPTIGQHVFTPITHLDDPFISPSLKINLGYSNSIATEIPVYLNFDILDSAIVVDDTLSIKAKLMNLNGSIMYRYQINDWAALAVKLHGTARLGSSTYTILYNGLSSISGLEAMWSFNMVKNERSMLTGSFGMNNQSYTYINIYEYIKNRNDTTLTSPNTLTKTYDALYSKVGLSYAFAWTDFFGFIASGNFGYGELPTNKFENDYFWDLGLYLDFNLDKPLDWPIGIGTKLTSYPVEIDKPRNFSRSVFFKFAYNAKRDIIIGVDTYYNNIPSNNGDLDLTFQFFKAQMNIQLYF